MERKYRIVSTSKGNWLAQVKIDEIWRNLDSNGKPGGYKSTIAETEDEAIERIQKHKRLTNTIIKYID
jgi:hypothetical protein